MDDVSFDARYLTGGGGCSQDPNASCYLPPSQPRALPETPGDVAASSPIPDFLVARATPSGASLFGTPLPSNPPLLSARWQKVDAWLRGQLESLPLMERNEGTLLVMEQLMARQERWLPDFVTKLYQKHQQRHAEEYAAETDRMDALLAAVGLDLKQPGSLPKQLEQCVDILANLALTLKLKDPDSTSFLSALTDVQLDSLRQRQVHETLTKQLKSVDNALEEAQNRLARQKGFLEQLQQGQAQGQQKTLEYERNTEMLKRKQKEYENRFRALEQTIQEAELEKLCYPALKELESNIRNVEAASLSEKQLLDAYLNLPPDMNLAKLETAKLRQQLKDRDAKRQQLIAAMANNLS